MMYFMCVMLVCLFDVVVVYVTTACLYVNERVVGSMLLGICI